jgi:hypothetical protein
MGAAVKEAPMTGPACEVTRFAGIVEDGQSFEHVVNGDYTFRLQSTADSELSGWTIEVRTPRLAGPENELSAVATPPHRFWNPRYIETSYGWTARQAIEYGDREFSFVRFEDYARLNEALVRLLWPNGATDAELEPARRTYDGMPRYPGRLRILDSTITPTSDGTGRLGRVRFDVELCVPARAAGSARVSRFPLLGVRWQAHPNGPGKN